MAYGDVLEGETSCWGGKICSWKRVSFEWMMVSCGEGEDLQPVLGRVGVVGAQSFADFAGAAIAAVTKDAIDIICENCILKVSLRFCGDDVSCVCLVTM